MFAVYTQRGDVYMIDISHNKYKLIKRATNGILCIHFNSHVANELLVSLENSTIEVYSIINGELLSTIHLPDPCTFIDTSTSQTTALFTTRYSILQYNTKDFSKDIIYTDCDNVIQSIYSPKNKYTIFGKMSMEFEIYKINEMNTISHLCINYRSNGGEEEEEGNECELTCFTISPNDQYLVACGTNPSVYIWDIVSENLIKIHSYSSPTSALLHMQYISMNKLAVLSDIGSIIVFDPNKNNGYIIAEYSSTEYTTIDFLFDKNNKHVVGYCDNGNIIIINTENENKKKKQSKVVEKQRDNSKLLLFKGISKRSEPFQAYPDRNNKKHWTKSNLHEEQVKNNIEPPLQ